MQKLPERKSTGLLSKSFCRFEAVCKPPCEAIAHIFCWKTWLIVEVFFFGRNLRLTGGEGRVPSVWAFSRRRHCHVCLPQVREVIGRHPKWTMTAMGRPI